MCLTYIRGHILRTRVPPVRSLANLTSNVQMLEAPDTARRLHTRAYEFSNKTDLAIVTFDLGIVCQ
jgi:hypothetical protein